MIPISVIHFIESATKNYLAPLYRNVGQKMMVFGLRLQGPRASDDRPVPSLRCRKYQGKYPILSMTNFVAPNATVFGDVKCKMNSSIWYGATLRCEGGTIMIGKNSVVQDNAFVISTSKETPVTIGNGVLLGPNCHVEDSQIEDGVIVGMGSSVGRKCILKHNSVLAPGACLEEGTVVESRQLWGGSPAVFIRILSSEEIDLLKEHMVTLKELAAIHSEEAEKSFRTLVNEFDKLTEALNVEDPAEEVIDTLIQNEMPVFNDDFEHAGERMHMDYFNKEVKYDPNEFYEAYHNVDEHFPDRFAT